MIKSINKKAFSSIHPNLQDILHNFELISSHSQRVQRLLKSSLGAFKDPLRADLVSEVTELTSYHALREIKRKMEKSETGKLILAEKPRIKFQESEIEELSSKPVHTLGHQYAKFMKLNQFNPSERPLVKYENNLELAYVHQRYKQVHDFLHVFLGLGIEPVCEIALKWFEMVQSGLPGTALSSFVGPLMLSSSSFFRLNREYLPLMLMNAYNAEFFMNIYIEKHLNDDISEFRRKYRYRPHAKYL